MIRWGTLSGPKRGELPDGTQNEECPTTHLITLIIGSIFIVHARRQSSYSVHLSGCKCKSVSWLMEDSLIHTEQISLMFLGALMAHNIQKMLNQSIQTPHGSLKHSSEAPLCRLSIIQVCKICVDSQSSRYARSLCRVLLIIPHWCNFMLTHTDSVSVIF